MPMIRPEAAATLRQWRAALVGAGVTALGLYWALFTGGGLLHWVGYVVAVAGVALLLAGVQRGRFHTGADGPGVVQVIEGQISYFGPLTGGAVAMTEITEVHLDPSGTPAHWVLHQPGQPPLHIPVNAAGSDALFDAFSALPGLDTSGLVGRMRVLPDRPTRIWQRSSTVRALGRLH